MTYEEIIKWHEVVKRPLTDEEIKEYTETCGYIPEYMLECPLPDDGQEILIATKWGVATDICCYDAGYYYDDGYYLENRGDWDDVIAWAKIPKYKVVE